MDQLQKVLARELEIKLTNKTEWKSVGDLSKAQEFGDYLKTHPLPLLTREKKDGEGDTEKESSPALSKAKDGGGDTEKGSSTVESIEFTKRHDQMTQDEYRSLEKDLERVSTQVFYVRR